jgi:hypothetical protein
MSDAKSRPMQRISIWNMPDKRDPAAVSCEPLVI